MSFGFILITGFKINTLRDPVSSIYIWSKNFSHSTNVKSEAKDGGH